MLDRKISNSHPKDLYYQIIRAICIFAVILIHCKNGIEYRESEFNWNYYYWIGFRQIINFPVSVFMFLAGYFVNQEVVIISPKNWVLNRLYRLYLPFLFWSFLYTIISVRRDFALDFIFVLKTFLKILIGYNGIHLYFVFILIQLIILTPLVLKHHNTKILILLTCIIFYILKYISVFNNWKYFEEYWKFLFPCFGIFYIFGIEIKVSNYKKYLDKIPLFFIVCLMFVFLCFSFFEAFVLNNVGINDNFVVSQVKLSSVFYSMSVIVFIIKLHDYIKSKSNMNFLILVGNNSFQIYFFHVIVLLLINKILKIIGIWDIQILFFVQMIQLLFVLLLSILVIFIEKKFFYRGNYK